MKNIDFYRTIYCEYSLRMSFHISNRTNAPLFPLLAVPLFYMRQFYLNWSRIEMKMRYHEKEKNTTTREEEIYRFCSNGYYYVIWWRRQEMEKKQTKSNMQELESKSLENRSKAYKQFDVLNRLAYRVYVLDLFNLFEASRFHRFWEFFSGRVSSGFPGGRKLC